MKKFKVLVLHNRYIHRGGEDVCVDNELDALREAGLDVRAHLVQNKSGLRGMTQAISTLWAGGHVATVEKTLRAEKPDLLHIHNLFPLLSPRIALTARQLGIPTVLTLHNYRPLCLNGLFLTPAHEVCERCPGENSYSPGIVRGCYRESRPQSLFMAGHLKQAERQGWYDAVQQFIAPSSFLRNKFVEHGFSPERITVQGHFLPAMCEEAPAAPAPYVLYLGRLSEEKGIRWLLRFFKENSVPCSLQIAGDGPLKNEVLSAQSDRVRYLGYLEGGKKEQALSQASALILPSECYENFPLAIMEANQWGVPVLAPALGGFTELVTHGVNGCTYSAQNDQSALSALSQILKNEALRTSSQEFARDRFSKQRFLNARLTLYESILAKRV